MLRCKSIKEKVKKKSHYSPINGQKFGISLNFALQLGNRKKSCTAIFLQGLKEWSSFYVLNVTIIQSEFLISSNGQMATF